MMYPFQPAAAFLRAAAVSVVPFTGDEGMSKPVLILAIAAGLAVLFAVLGVVQKKRKNR